jgi:DNA invertase Pin-like site-specific DNA recombinase
MTKSNSIRNRQMSAGDILGEKILLIYTRVSDKNSKKEIPHEYQEAETIKKGEIAGYTRFVTLPPEKESGFEFWDRPILQRALKMLSDGEAHGLGSYDLDRLSREPTHLGELLLISERGGWNLLFALGELSEMLSSMEGEMVFWVKSICAKYEAKKITQRCTSGKRKRIANKNLHGWGLEKYGYRRVVVRDGRLIDVYSPEAKEIRNIGLGEKQLIRTIYEPEAEIVRKIMELRGVNRWGIQKIANHLTKTDAPMPRTNGKSHGEWSPSTVLSIIRCRDYIGETVLMKDKIVRIDGVKKQIRRDKSEQFIMPEGVTPPIVSRELFELANQPIKTILKAESRNCDRPYLMRQRVHCFNCGEPMYARSKTRTRIDGSATTYIYYVCSTKDSSYNYVNMKSCGAESVRADGVDGLDADVMRHAENILNNPDWIRAEAERHRDEAVDPMLYGLRADCIKELEKLKKRRTNLTSAIERAEDEDDVQDLMKRRKELKDDIERVQAQIIDVDSQISKREKSALNLAALLSNLNAIKKRLKTGSFEDRRHVVESLGIEARVSGKSGKIVARLMEGDIPSSRAVCGQMTTDSQNHIISTAHCLTLEFPAFSSINSLPVFA